MPLKELDESYFVHVPNRDMANTTTYHLYLQLGTDTNNAKAIQRKVQRVIHELKPNMVQRQKYLIRYHNVLFCYDAKDGQRHYTLDVAKATSRRALEVLQKRIEPINKKGRLFFISTQLNMFKHAGESQVEAPLVCGEHEK